MADEQSQTNTIDDSLADDVTVNLSSNKLEEWPEDIPPNTKHLNVDHNSLTEIPSNIENLRMLEVLSAIGNTIQEVSSNIGQVDTLKELHLTENSLTSLPGALCEIHNLSKLYLLGNDINSLPVEIGSLTGLVHLDLSENKLTCLPDSFTSLVNLEFLDASYNDITIFPQTFGQLCGLKNLNLSNNGLQSLPDTFGDLRSVEILDLTSNNLTELPEIFRSSSCIREIYLDENDIDFLPPWFGDMPCATKLCIVDNSLSREALPAHMGSGCPLLEHLDFSGNHITVLPDDFGELSKLKYLDMGSILPDLERRVELLNGNMLRTLPLRFGGLRNLVELYLDENPLAELPEDFGGLSSLEILDFGQGSLTSLPDSFCNLTKLHTCSLAVNGLSKLPENFGNLTNLVSLRLEQNCLTDLPDSFRHLTKLVYLNLYSNRIKVFPQLLLELHNLQNLNAEENLFERSEDPNIYKPHSYPERDPLLFDNWRGRVCGHQFEEGNRIEVKTFEESGDEESGTESESPYSDSLMRRVAALNLTQWETSTEDWGASATDVKPLSPLVVNSEEAWEEPQDWESEEDWGEWSSEEYPYGMPFVHQHPVRKSTGFVPAELYRPSYLYLFVRAASQTLPVEEGQFDDLEDKDTGA